MNIITTNKETWEIAQQNEYLVWKNSPDDCDDWNTWWMRNFDNYSFLKNKTFENYMEVGCGPYAKNTINILSVLDKKPNIYLNDTLLSEYITANKSVKNLIDKNTHLYTQSLEDINLDVKMDCVVCINVLSHVYNVNKCMDNIFKILNPNGILIFGEDLTNEEDLISAPEILTDKMHPIRFNEEEIRQQLNTYDTMMYKTLNREQGRNPRAHYKTLLFAGKKNEVL